VAFLPGSQVDVRPVRDAGPLMGLKQPFQILKMDRRRGNIVVSRRAILEESPRRTARRGHRQPDEGQTVDGVVKNITEYGAFVDLGGVDGLLHVTDMAWRRVNHPSEILSIGETIKVQVIKINKETHRISLGMKQLQEDPWDAVEKQVPAGSVHKGRVTNITDYGAFVELEPGSKVWSTSRKCPGPRRTSTPARSSPPRRKWTSWCWRSTAPSGACRWASSRPAQPVGSLCRNASRWAPEIEGEVKNITEFGLFVGLDGDIDGMVHLSDLSWDQRGEDAIQNYRKGDTVQAVVTEVDVEKERISLSIKALGGDTFADALMA
jgi:small subunit ribosomal protein S1